MEGSKKQKNVKSKKAAAGKSIASTKESSDGKRVIWCFDHLDRNGAFAFTHNAEDFLHREILCKLIDYSSMTWTQVKAQTHDDRKSKHHLLEAHALSKEAQDRITQLHLKEYADSIFSFALNNKLRIIGIRHGRFFNVVWYDPDHKFCPSSKKHT